MTFVENGLGRPHDFGKSRSGEVESPIGGGGEKVRESSYFTSFIIFQSGDTGGGGKTAITPVPVEPNHTWSQNAKELEERMESAGLTHQLLDEALRVHEYLHPNEKVVISATPR